MMIKKQLACLLLSFVFSLQVLPVMAAPQINTDARVSYDTSGTVTVNISASQAPLAGEDIPEHRKNEAVYNIVRYTVSIKNSNEEYLVIDGGYTDETGKSEITYDVSASADSGRYSWECVVDGTSYEGSFRHINPTQAASAVERLNNGESLDAVIRTDGDKLGITYEEFSAVPGLEKWYDIYTAGNNSLEAAGFFKIYTQSEIKAKIANSKSDDVTRELIKENEKLIGFDYSQLEKETDAVNNDTITLLTSGANTADSLAKEIEICLGLSKLNNSQSSAWNIYADILVNTYADAFGIDVEAYNNKSNKSDIIKSVMANSYTSLSALVSAYNSALANVGKDNPNTTTGGGVPSGSATSGKGTTSITGGSKPVLDVTNPKFSDVSTDHWAYTYIVAMSRDGIVEGANGVFNPNQNVTRGEFAKIVQKAFYPKETADETAFNDVSSSDWYFNSVAVLASKGIINGVGEGIFAPNDTIKRQDMAVMFGRLADDLGISISAGSAEFKDIDSISDYAIDAVNRLASAEIISGDDEGNFMPQAMLTRAQICKLVYVFREYIGEKKATQSITFKMTDGELLSEVMRSIGIEDDFQSEKEMTAQEAENVFAALLSDQNPPTLENAYETVSSNQTAERLLKIMGYEPVIEALGGYRSHAMNLGIFKNCVSSDTPMTKQQFYTMIFDAIRLPLWSRENNKMSYSDDSILSLYHDIYKDKGTVTANRFTALSSNDYVGKDKIKIDDVIYKLEDINSESLLGRKVEFYYKATDDDEPQIVAIRVDEKGYKEFSINNDDIVSISGNTITYKRSDGVLKKITLENGYDLIVNNEYISDFDNLKDYILQDGSITLLDNSGKGWNMAIVKNYELMITSGISSSENVIYTNKGTISYNDMDDDVCVTVMLVDSDDTIREAEFDEIKPKSVLSVSRSQNGRYLYIISSEKTAEARIQSKSDDKIITAKGEEYDICGGVSISDINIGKVYTLYLDRVGRVADYDTNEKSYEYGYVVNAWQSEDGDTMSFTLFTQTGEKELTTKETVILDGERESASSSTVMDRFIANGNVQRQLIKYKLNSDGYIDALVTVSASNTTASDDTLIQNESEHSMQYADRMNSMDGRYLLNNAFIIGIPNGYEGDASRYVSGHSFENFSKHSVDIYDTDDDMFVGAMIYKTDNNAYVPEIKETSTVGIIKNITRGIDIDGAETDVVEMYTNGGYKKYAVSALYTSYKPYSDSNPTIKPGDVILYAINNDGEISGVVKRFDYSTKSVPQKSNGSYQMYGGTVYSKTDNFMTLVSGSNYDFDNRVVVPINVTKTYMVTVSVSEDGSYIIENIESGSANYINPIRDSSGTPSYVFAHTQYHGTVMSTVIYNEKN